MKYRSIAPHVETEIEVFQVLSNFFLLLLSVALLIRTYAVQYPCREGSSLNVQMGESN